MKEDIYNILDKDLIVDYIRGPKYCTIVFMLIDLIFVGIALFSPDKNLWVLAFCFFIPVIVMLVTYILYRQKYGFKIYVKKNNIIVYNYSGKRLRLLNVNLIKAIRKEILFDHYGFHKRPISCLLIFSNNLDTSKDLLYNEYWHDPNVLIIQNPEAIAYIEDKLKSISNS